MLRGRVGFPLDVFRSALVGFGPLEVTGLGHALRTRRRAERRRRGAAAARLPWGPSGANASLTDLDLSHVFGRRTILSGKEHKLVFVVGQSTEVFVFCQSAEVFRFGQSIEESRLRRDLQILSAVPAAKIGSDPADEEGHKFSRSLGPEAPHTQGRSPHFGQSPFSPSRFWLGPPGSCPFAVSFWGEGSPTEIDCRKKGTLILTSLLEDLVGGSCFSSVVESPCFPRRRLKLFRGQHVEPVGLDIWRTWSTGCRIFTASTGDLKR